MAALFQIRHAVKDDGELLIVESSKVGFFKPPSHIYSSAHDAGVAAGNVEEDPIKFLWLDGGRGRPIALCDFAACNTELVDILMEEGEAFEKLVRSENASGVVHQLGHEDCLAPWRGARVQD